MSGASGRTVSGAIGRWGAVCGAAATAMLRNGVSLAGVGAVLRHRSPSVTALYAKVDIEDLEGFFQVSLPEGPYESVGGLIIHQLGRVPEKGETMEIGSLQFRVMSATKRHIKTLKISEI